MSQSQTMNKTSLLTILPGTRARIVGFSAISPIQIEHLQAYGLVPGRWVRVRQHKPVTVVEVEHTELALETELADKIEVEPEKNIPTIENNRKEQHS